MTPPLGASGSSPTLTQATLVALRATPTSVTRPSVTTLCCERAGVEVNTEVDGVPGCTLALTDLSERKDKGSYKVVFPANSDQGLEVSLWIYPAPAPVSQPAVNVDPQGIFKPFCNVSFCSS